MTAPDVICGVWVGQVLDVGGVHHRGSWEPVHGMWGECRADCGLEAPGYLSALSGVEPLCIACWGPS